MQKSFVAEDSTKSGLNDAYRRLSQVSVKMSDPELDQLRVSLPAPVEAPWTGPFFDSKTCFDADKKEHAVKTLPIWIRKAVLAGETELAGRYLSSFLKLAKDSNPEVSTEAVLSLYKMGDYQQIAIGEMKKRIEAGSSLNYFESGVGGGSGFRDVRAVILDEMNYSNDRSLIQTVYDSWSRDKDDEHAKLGAVDYAYFLEQHGWQLPTEYWLKRLDEPRSFENAVEVLKGRASQEAEAKLGESFHLLRNGPRSVRAIEIASALYRLTGKSEYGEFLIETARAKLEAGRVEPGLRSALSALGRGSDQPSLDILASALRSDNVALSEAAIDALGHRRDPQARDLLVKCAEEKAGGGRGFPIHELRALLEEGEPEADSQYERLKAELLGGKLRWHATNADFAQLDFVRNHRRR
jgi:hypothetical protein